MSDQTATLLFATREALRRVRVHGVLAFLLAGCWTDEPQVDTHVETDPCETTYCSEDPVCLLASEGPRTEVCPEGSVTIECSGWLLAEGYFAEGYYCVSPDLYSALEDLCADNRSCGSAEGEDGVVTYSCQGSTCP